MLTVCQELDLALNLQSSVTLCQEFPVHGGNVGCDKYHRSVKQVLQECRKGVFWRGLRKEREKGSLNWVMNQAWINRSFLRQDEGFSLRWTHLILISSLWQTPFFSSNLVVLTPTLNT